MTSPRVVVLVEGESDRVALHTLADRCGRHLAAEGVEVVAMGGITNTRAFASHYGPRGLGVPLAGLYDAPEEAKLRHGLAAAGLGAALEPDGLDAALGSDRLRASLDPDGLGAALGPDRLSALGFFGCSVDLEDELLRALGVEAVEAVIEEAGETTSLRLLASMPAQRGLDPHRGAPTLPRGPFGPQGPLCGAAGRGSAARSRARAVGGPARPCVTAPETCTHLAVGPGLEPPSAPRAPQRSDERSPGSRTPRSDRLGLGGLAAGDAVDVEHAVDLAHGARARGRGVRGRPSRR